MRRFSSSFVTKKFLAILATVVVFPTIVFAQTVDINQYTIKVANNSGYQTAGVSDTTLSETIGRIIKIILSFTGVGFLILTIYAGFLWMTAGGAAEQVEKAQDIFKTATMGLIIIIGSYGIVVFVLAAIGAANNTAATSVGGVGPGSGSFWSSFGNNFKNNWWRSI